MNPLAVASKVQLSEHTKLSNRYDHIQYQGLTIVRMKECFAIIFHIIKFITMELFFVEVHRKMFHNQYNCDDKMI